MGRAVRDNMRRRIRLEMVPCTAASDEMLHRYLAHHRTITCARGAAGAGVAEQPREPITPWTWAQVIRAIALDPDVRAFSTHAAASVPDRSGALWVGPHAIATFVGHRSTQTTLQNIWGRDR